MRVLVVFAALRVNAPTAALRTVPLLSVARGFTGAAANAEKTAAHKAAKIENIRTCFFKKFSYLRSV
jgi:hypothetical protein